MSKWSWCQFKGYRVGNRNDCRWDQIGPIGQAANSIITAISPEWSHFIKMTDFHMPFVVAISFFFFCFFPSPFASMEFWWWEHYSETYPWAGIQWDATLSLSFEAFVYLIQLLYRVNFKNGLHSYLQSCTMQTE